MTGAELIAAERMRQIEEEGWTPEHDATHFDSEMAHAAMCYIDNAIYGLVKAGALIAAEIDRLQSCED